MNMLPEKLVLLMAVVRKNMANAVLARLLHTGIFHPVDIASIPDVSNYAGRLQNDFESSRWKDIEKRLNFISNETGCSFTSTDIAISYVEAETTLFEIEENLKPLLEKKYQLNRELLDLHSLIEKKPVYLPLTTGSYTFIHAEIGQIKAGMLGIMENMLGNIPSLTIPGEEKNGLIIIGIVILKKDLPIFERIKKEIGWLPVPSDITISEIPIEQHREKIEKLKDEIEENNRKINKVVEKNKEILCSIATSIEIVQKISIARKNTGTTETTMIISGWIPADQHNRVSEIITKTDPVSYCQFIPAEKTGIPIENIPVLFRHNRFLKPFELIVQTYGLSRYKTLDPALFVALSFLLIFGAMFGDIGHGIVFIILGFFLLLRAKGNFKQAGYLVSYTGFSSAVFGVLYGSFFGIEFHPIWLNPVEDISKIFKACIIIGAIILTAGIIINIINHIINRDKASVFFDKAGVFSGLIFWTGAAMTGLYISNAGQGIIKILGLIFAAAILTVFLRVVFEAVKHREGILVGLIEGVLHVFEILMGYLANTVSFIRIAAFAINHFGFFMTIFAISDMLRKTTVSWLSWPVIILGNVFVIILEGLVVMIQSLRLNYYEFFSRFFIPGNTSYQPLSITAFNEKIEEYIT
ncbi:MAG: hypothetical protein N2115_03905 [bacterium]|nr:hypothetical protein [bacterium]